MRIIKESIVDLELYDTNYKDSSKNNWIEYNIDSISIDNESKSCKIIASSNIKKRKSESLLIPLIFNDNSMRRSYLTLVYNIDYSIRIEFFVYVDSLKINNRKIKILDLVVNKLDVIESYYSNGNSNVDIDHINKAKEFITKNYKEDLQLEFDDPFFSKEFKLIQQELSFEIKEF